MNATITFAGQSRAVPLPSFVAHSGDYDGFVRSLAKSLAVEVASIMEDRDPRTTALAHPALG